MSEATLSVSGGAGFRTHVSLTPEWCFFQVCQGKHEREGAKLRGLGNSPSPRPHWGLQCPRNPQGIDHTGFEMPISKGASLGSCEPLEDRAWSESPLKLQSPRQG